VRPARRWCAAAALAGALLVGGAPGGVRAERDLSPIDLVDLEVSYDTLTTQYYRHVDPQRLIDGARVGIVAYLRGCGIEDPSVPTLRANGRYAHDLHVAGQEVAQALVRYGTRIDPHELVYGAIDGEASALRDPYTVFFTADQERQFQKFLNPQSFGGIGVIIGVDRSSGRLSIDQVIPGGPGDKGGLLPGDWILAIDGVPVQGVATETLEGRLRGKAGTVVGLTYGRGTASSVTVRLVRASVTPPDVFSRMLPGGIGYVQLTSYGSNAPGEMHAQLRRLESQDARAYVLDLRDNGGGYRDAAVAITSEFVPHGPIMVVQARNGKRTTTESVRARVVTKPLAVLVNGNTASGAEITAGAIQDLSAGLLVGTRTFGKGLVQAMYPLPDGAALKVTVERYYTARGRDIDRKGIDPDLTVEQPAGSVAGDPARDPQLASALGLLATRLASPTP